MIFLIYYVIAATEYDYAGRSSAIYWKRRTAGINEYTYDSGDGAHFNSEDEAHRAIQHYGLSKECKIVKVE